jgi:hypothetical protein
MNKTAEAFDELVGQLDEPPSNAVFDFGKMLERVLRRETNRPVDTGAGFSQFDLWAKHKGREFYITVKLARSSMN